MPICCEDLIYFNDSTRANGIITLEIEVILDKNSDSIFGNTGDETQTVGIDILVLDYIKNLECPADLILPCTTTDTSPDKTGQAIVNATCFDSYKASYTDVLNETNPDKKIITRTFSFGGNAGKSCVQKIELDCTVSSDEVLYDHVKPEVVPNPFSNTTHLNYTSHDGGQIKLSVVNSSGMVVSTLERSTKPGPNQMQLEETLFSGAGIYFVEIQEGDKKYFVKAVKVD